MKKPTYVDVREVDTKTFYEINVTHRNKRHRLYVTVDQKPNEQPTVSNITRTSWDGNRETDFELIQAVMNEMDKVLKVEETEG